MVPGAPITIKCHLLLCSGKASFEAKYLSLKLLVYIFLDKSSSYEVD